MSRGIYQIRRGICQILARKTVDPSYDRRASAQCHVDRLLGTCPCSLHALLILHAHGLPQDALHNVGKATLLSRLLYVSSSWWGMTSADDRLKMECFINKLRCCLPANQATMEIMIDVADRCLLCAVVTRNSHVLFFPPILAIQYDLSPRPHNFKFPEKYYVTFIPRILYKR